MKKCCTKCNVKKLLIEFSKCKAAKDGLQWKCKECMSQYAKQNPITDLKKRNDYVKKWQKDNLSKIVKNNKKWATKKSGIYEWYENDICLYVGQSTWLLSRVSTHKCWLKNPESAPKDNRPLYISLRQHQNPQIRIIEECPPEVLLEREQYYIDTKKPLYNKDNNESNKCR